MVKHHASINVKKSVCKAVKNGMSIRMAATANSVAASTVFGWMEHFITDPSFKIKKRINISVSDYLDDVGKQLANEKTEELNRSTDDTAIYCGVTMEKNICMHLFIEDLANASCIRRERLPFLCQDLNFNVVESLRLCLITEYDAETSDDTNSISTDPSSNDHEPNKLF